MFDTCVLGIDPGVARLGLAVVARRERKAVIVWTGTVETSRATPEAERLHIIASRFAERSPSIARRPGARAGWPEREQASAMAAARATGVVRRCGRGRLPS
jgi:Holliday junction resolvasome RuvABC endonuclease subunit